MYVGGIIVWLYVLNFMRADASIVLVIKSFLTKQIQVLYCFVDLTQSYKTTSCMDISNCVVQS